MATIHLEKIRKQFATGPVVLHDLDLEVVNGELLVLVGPSGCGKTTTLRIVAGLETPSAGRVRIGSEDVTAWPPRDRDLAMVFQSHTLYPHMTVRQNLEFPLRLRGVNAAERCRRVDQVTAVLGIEGLLDRNPAQLSGGQKQRVALGRAMVRQPRAFLLDEPLANLDAGLRVQARAELARMHRHMAATLVWVTHDQEEAMTLGDRMAVLAEGRLQQVGTPLEIYQRPANRFVAGFIGSPAMNFFPARLVDNGTRRQLESPFFQRNVELPSVPASPAEVVVGIRPQDICLAPAEAEDLRGRVDGIQPLGSDVLVHLALPGPGAEVPMTLLASADTPIKVGTTLAASFRRDRLHLFDASSGQRLPGT